MLVEEQERLAVARYTGQAVAHAMGADLVPTYEDPRVLVDEWLASDLPETIVSEADMVKAEWMDVMFARSGGSR